MKKYSKFSINFKYETNNIKVSRKCVDRMSPYASLRVYLPLATHAGPRDPWRGKTAEKQYYYIKRKGGWYVCLGYSYGFGPSPYWLELPDSVPKWVTALFDEGEKRLHRGFLPWQRYVKRIIDVTYETTPEKAMNRVKERLQGELAHTILIYLEGLPEDSIIMLDMEELAWDVSEEQLRLLRLVDWESTESAINPRRDERARGNSQY